MRFYDKEFKEQAIKLSYELGATAAAEQLGIPVTTIYTWRTRTQQYGATAFVGSEANESTPKQPKLGLWRKRSKN